MDRDNAPAPCVGMTPILTTPAGSCLTPANWQEAGVGVASCYLAALLMKPGFDVLRTLPHLASYVSWEGLLVLNASLPPISADGVYTWRSHYDGSRIRHSIDDILALIASLQPHMVILPEGMWQKYNAQVQLLPETIFPFIPLGEVSESSVISRSHGIYIEFNKKTSSTSTLLEQLHQYEDKPYYVAGDLDLPLMAELVKQGVTYVESDRPADDACHGRVYCGEGELAIEQRDLSMQFALIDEHCHCPTCSQQFTRAYLHHLFEQTPLLCQRLLVQHNVHYCNTWLTQEAFNKE